VGAYVSGLVPSPDGAPWLRIGQAGPSRGLPGGLVVERRAGAVGIEDLRAVLMRAPTRAVPA
jgi:hypothetical protein